MSRRRSGPGDEPPADPGERVGRPLVRADQGTGRARGRAPPQARGARAHRNGVRQGLPSRRGVMARRIVFTMLALVGALLVTAVIPLGLLTTARERGTFREETLLSARAFAALAEDGLTKHTGSRAMASFLSGGSLSGEASWVYNTAGRLVAHVRRPVTTTDGDDTSGTSLWVPAGMVTAALRHG